MTTLGNNTAYGTLTADGSTDDVVCRGWTTLSAHYDSGTGTLTWQFKGPDGVWRTVYGSSDNITAQAYTASHMVNVFFGGDVRVRGTLSGSAAPQIDWQIMGAWSNRD